MAAPAPEPAESKLDDDWGEDAPMDGDDGWGDVAVEGDDWGPDGGGDESLMASAVVSPILTRQQSCEVLDNTALSAKQEALVRQTAEVLFVTASEAGCLLRHYGWKARKLQSEWFEDQALIRRTVGLTAEEDAKRPQKNAEGLVQCQSAYCDEVAEDQAKALNCGHVFCNDCWQNYLTSQISHGSACVFTTCPGMRCTDSHVHRLGCACNEMVPEALFRRYVSDSALLEKYSRWMLDSFVEGNKSIKWCPKPGCTYAVSYQSGGTRSIQCRCGHYFCYSCLQEAHSPAPCDIVRNWLQREKSDDATEIWLQAKTKECPKCQVRIEKNKACNHMTCIKCGHHFCWLCKESWDKHGSSTGGYYACASYDASVKAGKLSSEEQKNIESQKVLQKYTYYYKRYKSSWDGVTLTRQLGDKLEKQLKNHDLAKFAFAFDAIDKLVAARRVLQWTYALAYYLRAGPQKQLFEYQQDLLVVATESLQDLMERHDRRDLDGLQALRKDIINKGASIDKFRNEMVNQLERGDFEDLLLSEADNVVEKWTCANCKTDNGLKATHCSNPACGACQLHGEPDCKSTKCKQQAAR